MRPVQRKILSSCSVILAKARLLYASFISLILQAVRFTVTMLLKGCVANIIFGQERLTEQFLSMHFFYDSILFTKRCSPPSEHFALNALFLWEHSLCAPEGAERQWAAPGQNSWNGQTWRDPLWNIKQKMALTLRPPPQVYCSPSSAQTNVIIKPV